MKRSDIALQLNKTNFSRSALIATIIAVIISLSIKLFFMDVITPYFELNLVKKIFKILNIVETVCLINIILFMLYLIAPMIPPFQRVSITLSKNLVRGWYFSILISFITITFTTFIEYTFFKPWLKYIFLLVIIAIPFVFYKRLQKITANNQNIRY
jgi:hypothetical protein